MKNGFIIITLMLLLCQSCGKQEVDAHLFIYGNDFETGDYTGLTGVFISRFDNSLMMGPFNNSGFRLTLNDLPAHDFIRVTFDLYIHDSWEGNSNDSGTGELDHDAWFIEFEPDENIDPADKIIFETTFANTLCIPAWCFNQSYPNPFPSNNDARTGARQKVLNGRCLWQDTPNGTSVYKINKVFPHTRTSTVISIYDELKQDAPFSPLCEESWSLDNLAVSVFTTE